jgi:hypothetical protein
MVALGACLGPMAGCFDSDEKYQPIAPSTSTTGTISTTSSSSSSSSTSSSTTAEPEETCRDAIQCVQACLTELQLSMSPEPDLTCFLECEPGLTSEEVLDLFHLAECVTNKCIDDGHCDVLLPDETTSTGGSSSSSSSGSSSTGTDTGTSSTTGLDPTTECLNCVIGGINDPAPPGCMEVAAQCV